MLISYRYDGQNSVGLSVPQKDVDERNDLQSLAQAHAVSQDAAKATAGLVPIQRFNEVIIEKPDPSNLWNKEKIKFHPRQLSLSLR